MNTPLRRITSKLKRNTLCGTRNFYYRRRVQEGCECAEPCEDKIKVIEEKKCTACSFVNWKPKPKKIIECQIKQDMKPKLPKRCYAGMALSKPPPDCSYDEIDPFKKKCCMHQKQAEKKAPTLKTPEKEIPYADWDSDCK